MRFLTLQRQSLGAIPRMTYADRAGDEPLRGPLTIIDADTGEPAVVVTHLPDPGTLRAQLRDLDGHTGTGAGIRARRAGFSYKSTVFGYGPRNPLRKRYGCAPCALSGERPALAAELDGLAAAAAGLMGQHAPAAYARQTEAVAPVLDEWRLAGGLWTSGIINFTASLPYHRDGNNFARSWSAMLCLRQGVRGGALHVPEYGVWLACEDRAVVMFCGSDLWHAVTPLEPVAKAAVQYRYTLVLYAVAAMASCLPAAEEVNRARVARTEAEGRIASSLTSRPATPAAAGSPSPPSPPRPAPAEAPAEFDREQHWTAFREFCLYELAAGGPDPHMRYVEWMSRDEPWDERLWRAGVYVGVYNTASAEVIWQHWPREKAVQDPDGLATWLAENWKGLRLRRERRTARTPKKLAECLNGYAAALPELTRMAFRAKTMAPTVAYEDAWATVNRLPRIGRYAGFKLIEVLRRSAELAVEMPDIRARGGYSPRLTLGLLHPELADAIDAHRDSPSAIAVSEAAADQVLERLHAEGLPVDRYLLEVFLCDYRQSYEGRRQYPGRSNDSELEYHAAIAPYWGARYESSMWEARAALNPAVALGERGGWTEVRKELGPVLRDHGFTWSDWKYVYRLGDDPAHPEERADADREDAHRAAAATLGAG